MPDLKKTNRSENRRLPAEMANQAQLREINSKELDTLASDMKKVAKLA
ncbi:MAG: hypothetical protein ACLTX3_08315 [Lachnospiraceae bacterium]